MNKNGVNSGNQVQQNVYLRNKTEGIELQTYITNGNQYSGQGNDISRPAQPKQAPYRARLVIDPKSQIVSKLDNYYKNVISQNSIVSSFNRPMGEAYEIIISADQNLTTHRFDFRNNKNTLKLPPNCSELTEFENIVDNITP